MCTEKSERHGASVEKGQSCSVFVGYYHESSDALFLWDACEWGDV